VSERAREGGKEEEKERSSKRVRARARVYVCVCEKYVGITMVRKSSDRTCGEIILIYVIVLPSIYN